MRETGYVLTGEGAKPSIDDPPPLRTHWEHYLMSVSAVQPDASVGPIIRLVDVDKWFGEFHVLKGINLSVARGERIVVCGPSGSGKSTMIRCINRLEEHQRGQIIVDGVEVTNNLRDIEAVRREVGMVFQHFNLFPHLTVLENCTLAPILVRKTPKVEAEAAAMKYLERVRIPEQATKYPASFQAASSSGSPLRAPCA